MNKNNSPTFGKDNIRFPGKIFVINLVTKAMMPKGVA